MVDTALVIVVLVGLARIYYQAHFASNLVAGALIGTRVGKSVVSYNNGLRSAKVALLPELAPGLIGVRIAGSF